MCNNKMYYNIIGYFPLLLFIIYHFLEVSEFKIYGLLFMIADIRQNFWGSLFGFKMRIIQVEYLLPV